MNKKTITVDVYYDDNDPDSYIILPSGFADKYILVNESPAELVVQHISEAQRSVIKAASENT